MCIRDSPWRSRGRSESCRPHFGQQESRSDSRPGVASDDRIHPGRLFPDRDEKTVPDLFPYFRFATLRHLYQCGSSGIADPDRSAGSASLRRGRNGRNQPSVVCGGGIRSVILFCYSIPFCRSAELSCCRSDRRTGISETIRYFSLGAGLVSPLSAGREMPYRTARIRMRITEQAAMNCVGAAGRSRYIQR